ncbi:YdeI/OmpD-associated family protein [uncultured Arcticibacterium sp.]|uniref:YdeI/OmpD-associated family protein n=1 Tax=uncultured Arcticibacterium sp. TaxID=2173042 RepID=UPI0030F62745
MKKDIETFYPKSQADWRTWLLENHKSQESVWLLFYKVSSLEPSITWSEAVDEALCFGWIDSKKQTIDKFSYRQFFSKRKPKSTWSKINKDKVQTLEKKGLMTPEGLKCIDIAKENGSWTMLDAIDALIIPDDLEKEFAKHSGSKEFFENLSKSQKKIILYWVTIAKREETKAKRMSETAVCAAQNQLPKHLR